MNVLPVSEIKGENFLAAYTAVNTKGGIPAIFYVFLAAYTAVNRIRNVRQTASVFLAAYTAVN